MDEDVRKRQCGACPSWSDEDVSVEFHVTLSGAKPDPAAIANLICAIDAAALVDLDPASDVLRVATSLSSDHLATLLAQAGYPVAPQQIIQLPSVCCGGCGG